MGESRELHSQDFGADLGLVNTAGIKTRIPKGKVRRAMCCPQFIEEAFLNVFGGALKEDQGLLVNGPL